MVRKQRLTIALVLALAELVAGRPCFAQDATSGNYFNHFNHVLVEGGNDVSPALVKVVMATLQPRFAAAGTKAGVYRLDDVEFLPNIAKVSDHVQVGSLRIGIVGPSGSDFDQNKFGELWEKARKQVEAALREVQRSAGERQAESVNLKRVALERRKAENQDKLDRAIGYLQDMELNSSGTPEQLADATNQLRQLKLTRIGVTARREAIEKRIDELRAAADASADNDPVLDELEKVVQIREQQMQIVAAAFQAGAGATSASDLSQAQAAVAEARVALLKTKRSLATDSNGSLLASLNDELAKLYVDDAEMEAKGRALAEMVDELQKQLLVSSRTNIDQARDNLKRYRTIIEQTEQALLELESDEAPHREIRIRPLEDLLPKEEAEAAAK